MVCLLLCSLNDLANTKTRLSDAEAEKQRLMRDIEDLSNKLQWLQRINSQLENSASQLEHYRKQVRVSSVLRWRGLDVDG